MEKIVYINELESLKCILDTLVFEDEPSIFTEEHSLDLIETALHLMEECMKNNPTIISEPDFHDILLEEIKDLFFVQIEEQFSLMNEEDIEDDMNEILEVAFQIYISVFCTERSIQKNDIVNEITKSISKTKADENIIETKINRLRNIPQPEQRTNEWYKFRHNLITASNAYKAFETQSTMNQLIYEKCQPIKMNVVEESDVKPEVKLVNTNTTLHWGQKYEPLSVMIYENMYNTKVEDFGCIKHDKYSFLGASPDGIIVDPASDRYGRMLEIKNIVNREITGIPKKEYWVQMQLQMEVCDLDECDFLETKFTEYPDSASFYEELDNKDKIKGTIIYFHKKEGNPFYFYKPLHITEKSEMIQWEEENISLYEEKHGYTFMKIIYWKLEKLSCVLVSRNKEWFSNNIQQLQNIWNIIENERIHGYEHRAPNRKPKKEIVNNPIHESQGCLLTIKKY